VPPLREAQLRDVVSRPADLLSARFETDHLAVDIARRTAEESTKAAGALPLLSYLLDDMWSVMVACGDGMLRLPAAAMELGGVLAERANAFLARNPRSEDALRRVLTLRLATVREDGEPTRRRAVQSEFSEEEWRLVSELADHPNRLLVTAMPENGEPYAEVAHETIFRRWERLRDWIAAERDFLAWRPGLESARRAWQAAPEPSRGSALLMGLPLVQAKEWLGCRGKDVSRADHEFVNLSVERDAREQTYLELLRKRRDSLQRRTRQMGVIVGVLLLGIGAGIAWSSRAYLEALAVTWGEVIWPRVLTAEAENALKPGQDFKECAHCPVMVVVPGGRFVMGSPKGTSNGAYEEPQHDVLIKQRFAVSRFEVTFEEWDACVTLGGCTFSPSDEGWGRGTRPVINVNWDDVQQYVTWLSKRTGKSYRLLSEAEWEYAARAGTSTKYFWGDEIGQNNANCVGCGSQWDRKQTAPVGSFGANAFGLYDMHGNVTEWTQDCYHKNYEGAPEDGSAWITSGDCQYRVMHSGSWLYGPYNLRSAYRVAFEAIYRLSDLGFRLGRTLTP
jgi:formylglycine-generating enzyme required for sulfatase activity